MNILKTCLQEKLKFNFISNCNNCKEKYLRRFSDETPEGNCIKGWICHKPNRYLGSLLIDEVNGEKHEQYVQSMPKIEYFNDERDICLDSEICGVVLNDAIAYEKLDGSLPNTNFLSSKTIC